MLPDGLSTQTSIPEPERHDRGFRPAILTSLLLHGVMVLAFGRAAFAPPQKVESAPIIDPVNISIVGSSPQRRRALATRSANAARQPATPERLPVPAPIRNPAPTPSEAIAVAEAVPPADSGAGTQREPVLDMDSLQESISGYMATYRSEGLEQQLRECQQYRDRYARWDCPEGEEPLTETQARIEDSMEDTFRTWVYGYDLNIVRSEKLKTEMLALRPLMEKEGVMGEVARHAHLLRVAEYERLNPGQRASGNNLTLGVGPNRGPSTGGTITVFSIGAGGLSVLNGVLGIGWNGKVHVKERAPARKPDDGRIRVPERAPVPEK
jgi:hypothetical protein